MQDGKWMTKHELRLAWSRAVPPEYFGRRFQKSKDRGEAGTVARLISQLFATACKDMDKRGYIVRVNTTARAWQCWEGKITEKGLEYLRKATAPKSS